MIGQDAGTGELLSGLVLAHYNELHTSNNAKRKSNLKLPLLFLVGETHRDVIPKTLMDPALPVDEQIQVEELIVYETGVMGSFAVEFERALEGVGAWGRVEHGEKGEGEGEEDAIWIVVFSPTGCDTMLRTLNLLPPELGSEAESDAGNNAAKLKLRRNCYIATIGPTTRDHLLKFGIRPDVCAERPSPEGVGVGIERFMEEERRKN